MLDETSVWPCFRSDDPRERAFRAACVEWRRLVFEAQERASVRGTLLLGSCIANVVLLGLLIFYA